MSTNTTLQSPYLRTSRNFPQESQQLSVEINKSYVDIASYVNARIIGVFPKTKPAITGEQWYLSGGNTKQQTLRQVYTFTAAGNIAHGINLANISGFTRIYGTVQDNSGNWYPLPLVSSTDVTAQISLKVTSTNIVVSAGAAAITIANGYIVLEFLANP